MKSTYIVMNVLMEVLLLIGILFTPIYVTPGWYFWSIFLFVLMFANGFVLTRRIEEWNRMDLLK